MNRRQRRQVQRDRKKQEARLLRAASQPQKEGIGSTPPSLRARAHFGRTISTSKSIFGILGAAIAIFSAWVLLQPEISINPYVALNPPDPFSVKFEIANESYDPMRNVTGLCQLNEVTFAGGSDIANSRIKRGTGLLATSLAHHERTTFDCSVFRGLDPRMLTAVDISIVVEYRPAWWFRDIERSQRFVGTVDRSGEYHWLPRPKSQ